jgi:hypothetical protein
MAELERGKITSSFRPPATKKIVPVNLYNPHSEVEDEKRKPVPGPGTYAVPSQFFDPESQADVDKVLPNVGGKVYVDNNQDRFGRPILPRKPRELVPGPGEYQIERPNEVPMLTKGGYVSQMPLEGLKPNGIPGPAFYNPAIEPKKISFLFNAAEKWTN